MQKSWMFVAGATLVFVVIVVGVIAASKPKFDTNVTLTIDRPNPINQQDVNYYLYDNYYTQQSSGLFADTIINWMQSPGVVQAIYTRAALPVPPVRNVTLLGKIFTVRKYPPATVSITYRSTDNQQGRALMEAATKELQEQANAFSQKNHNDQLVLHATAPVSAEVKPFWVLDVLIAVVIGLLFSTFAIFLREYLRPHRES